MKTKLPNITSDNARLHLIFDTNNAKPGRGFKIKYEFQTGFVNVSSCYQFTVNNNLQVQINIYIQMILLQMFELNLVIKLNLK